MMLLAVITVATASDSSSDSSSHNNSSTTTAGMLFQAVQYLRPLPESWSPDVPLDEWEGVTVATPPNCVVYPGMPSPLYSIVIDAGNFSSDSTLRLDLLDPKAPMCNMTVLSSSVASIIVMINASHLPLSLQFLDLSQTEVVTTSPFSQRYVDFAKLPSFIGYVDLSHTGIEGNLDLSLIGQTEGVTFKYVNVSGNVGLVGGVDLTGAAGPLIDLRGTGISTIVVRASQQNMIGPSQSNGTDHTIFVDASVRVLPVTTEEVFLLEVGYYCVSPSNTSMTTDRAMLNVYQSNGQYILRMINPPYECETPFDPKVTFNEGYLLKCTTLAMLLYP
ncbi:GPI-anchored surface protein, putative [Bodo saltans]|uniref:GPI-anchored surface protein, putative n=1 Tax=Bodo saltans TaxID=75058 RepID=A0A0S4JIF2_BODSA|nr:GPI-anchored surface protein, putative [Bodo saltans]|eukprot:CUG88785.1 GPI-anchored surface protein, putative [Bodo saltans]